MNERGLSTAQREKYGSDMLEFILDDLMPWHTNEELNDYSLLEVNRYRHAHMHTCKHSLHMHAIHTQTL